MHKMKSKSRSGVATIRRFSRAKAQGEVVVGEAVAFLRSLRDESADIVFLDPPFNLGKEYIPGKKSLDRQPEHSYRTWLFKVLYESTRVLKVGGALYLYHLPQWAMQLGAFLGENGDLAVRHANRKYRKANELSPVLFDRVLGISGRKGGLYVDPFAGAGSGAVRAVAAGMRFAVCDLVRNNCSIICDRLDALD